VSLAEPPKRLSRTEAVGRAMLRELRSRREHIDGNVQLSSVVIEVFLQDGPVNIRGVSYGDRSNTARHRPA